MVRLIIGLMCLSSSAWANEHLFENIDVFQLEVAADPQISPDGSTIIYVRRSMDIMSDRGVSNLWRISSDGSNHRPLLTGAQSFSSPRWSPDGEKLVYVTRVEGRGPQLHLRWMDTGDTAVLTNLRRAPRSISWSPDGTQLVFQMFVKGKSKPLAKPPSKPKGAKWAPPVKVIDSIVYRQDGAGYVDPGHNHLFVLSAEGGTPRQLTEGDYNHNGPVTWKNNNEIIFSANRNKDWRHDPLESDLWSLNINDGTLDQLTERDGPDSSPAVSPDGSKVAYLGFDDKLMGYHNADVYIMDIDTGETEAITGDLDRSVGDVAWARNSRRLYIQYDDEGKSHLASLGLDGSVSTITDTIGGVALGRPYTSGGFSLSDNDVYVITGGAPLRPSDVAVGRGTRSPTTITSLNEDLLGHKKLGAVEELRWQSSADDLEIQGWVVKPPNFDANKKYPLILEIHGGPFAAYGPQFSPEVQLFAAAGYVVLYANPRGSTSYGYDFANEIHHNYPGQDYDDLMSGVDAVIEQGYVDEEQLFVTGGSGGGVLTSWIIGKTDRFAAAVVAKPVINWTSFSLTADFSTFFTRYWFADMPWENPNAYWERSPLSLVGNVKTPTALLTGEADYRTPISESEQYYQALKLRKIDTALIRVPEASHGIAARPSHLIAKIDNVLAWFERYREKSE
ncbi:MAG: S9 family peptidase [Pseudomonadota bacterium]